MIPAHSFGTQQNGLAALLAFVFFVLTDSTFTPSLGTRQTQTVMQDDATDGHNHARA
jgi:hypothetical protein